MMVQNFMASLPNTHFFMHDFNLARNFNQEALSKLLISVFPIHSILFYFGNLYAILDKLAEAGVTLTFHRAYNSLIGLTGYTLKTGSDAQLMSIAERWGYRIDQYTDFDPTSFNTLHCDPCDCSNSLRCPCSSSTKSVSGTGPHCSFVRRAFLLQCMTHWTNRAALLHLQVHLQECGSIF